MSTMMHRYKALPQMTKNYIQLGALVTGLGGFYYRGAIRAKMYPSERTTMDSINMAKKKPE
ncbi:hypothetical protein KI688_012705 [Linnemannia hyalina]|uniref:Uncharacterized protein n=1 Tax=Linnemannia hyalina TaxID=64524 RepID=A0A9P7XV68_9FUNG|nr:hypothetical protein KI688_012705 [Linnemannia hyalina]